MKKATQSLFLLLSVAFFMPFFAFAQSAPLILIAQGQLNATSSVHAVANAGYTIKIGSGFEGSTTGAVVAVSSKAPSGTDPNFELSIFGYFDAAYTSADGECDYEISGPPSTDGFLQLNPFSESNHGCSLNSNEFYEIVLAYNNFGYINWIYGSRTNNQGWSWSGNDAGFFPMFDVLGNGWVLVPTTTDSGLSLSGAQAFCNSQFGTSSSIASDFGSAICTGLGFLFIPSQNAVQQFADVPNTLSTKLPFSYFYALTGLYNGLFASSSNFVDIGFDISSTSVKNTRLGVILPPVVALSTSTVSTYIPAATLATLRTLMSAVIWLSFAYFVYRKTQGLLT